MCKAHNYLLISLALLLFSDSICAQLQPRKELLKDVSFNKEAKLSEYNRNFLERELYFSLRYRIVEVDTKLLLKENAEFTITPFKDLEPILVKSTKSMSESADYGYWIGKQEQPWYKDAIVKNESGEVRTNEVIEAVSNLRFYLTSWDVNRENATTMSFENKFEFSEMWDIDESGKPILLSPPNGKSIVVGPPPSAPEDIERHRKLKQLKRKDFYSVKGAFAYRVMDLIEGDKFFKLVPLEYTPRYSVIYEIDINKEYSRPPLCDIPDEECIDSRSEIDKINQKARSDFIKKNPKQDQSIVGDIQ